MPTAPIAGRRRLTAGGSWRASCAAAGSGSRRSRSACRRRPGAGRLACAARRSPRSPGSASPGTPGSSKGRDINASPQVLDAVARTLLLDPHEREHLFRLADAPDGAGQAECKALPPTGQTLLDQLEPFPACIRNARYDILAWNSAYEFLMGDLSDVPFEERNSLWRVFTSDRCRACILDWEEGTRRMVAEYRAAMAEHLAEPAWKCLVSRLTKASPEFAELWERHEVASPENLTKRFLHPDVGLLKLNYTHLWLGQRLGTRMTTYTPADADSLDRLRQLQRRPG